MALASSVTGDEERCQIPAGVAVEHHESGRFGPKRHSFLYMRLSVFSNRHWFLYMRLSVLSNRHWFLYMCQWFPHIRWSRSGAFNVALVA